MKPLEFTEQQLEDMVAYFKKKEKKKAVNTDRMRKFFNDEESFSNLMERVIKKHDDRWVDVCYKKNVMPHPWHILYSIYDIVEKEGIEVKPLDGLTSCFPSVLIEYMNWTFAITHGQGSVLSIYRKGQLVYRD